MNLLRASVIAVALVAAPVCAQEKAATKPGFVLPADPHIVVFRPDVKAGTQAAGGIVTPNAAWTEAARKHLAAALVAARPGGAKRIVFMPELEGEDAALLDDHRALFRAVAGTVLQHRLFKGNRLPTKLAGFDYTLGNGVSRLATIGGGDFGLFVTTQDAFGDAGRKAMQVLGVLAAAATGFGAAVTSGVHTGYAGLVDLRTGELVWLNADLQMGGDVREPEGAAKRVAQLLEEFPGR